MGQEAQSEARRAPLVRRVQERARAQIWPRIQPIYDSSAASTATASAAASRSRSH